MVVARLHPQADRGVARFGGGGREGAGEELVLQEAVGGALRKNYYYYFKKRLWEILVGKGSLWKTKKSKIINSLVNSLCGKKQEKPTKK